MNGKLGTAWDRGVGVARGARGERRQMEEPKEEETKKRQEE